MDIEALVGRMDQEQTKEAFVLALQALTSESLEEVAGEVGQKERDRLREALDAVEA